MARSGALTAKQRRAIRRLTLALRERNPEWGLRDLEAVVSLATASGLELSNVTDMPANNLSVVFRKLA